MKFSSIGYFALLLLFSASKCFSLEHLPLENVREGIREIRADLERIDAEVKPFEIAFDRAGSDLGWLVEDTYEDHHRDVRMTIALENQIKDEYERLSKIFHSPEFKAKKIMQSTLRENLRVWTRYELNVITEAVMADYKTELEKQFDEQEKQDAENGIETVSAQSSDSSVDEALQEEESKSGFKKFIQKIAESKGKIWIHNPDSEKNKGKGPIVQFGPMVAPSIVAPGHEDDGGDHGKGGGLGFFLKF